jgi:hypothetical protein
MPDRPGHAPREDFFPRGAVASFLLMVGVYALLWVLMYALMVSRG